MSPNILGSYKDSNSYNLRLLSSILSIMLLFVISALIGFDFSESSSREPVANEERPQMSISAREKLHYDIYWVGIYAGEAFLEAINDKGTLRITSKVYSAPFISVFYKVEDYAESLIRNGRPVNFRIKQREGRYRSDKETIFDLDNGKITYFDYLKKKKNEHTITDESVWDVISGFYYLRFQPLEVGNIVYVNIFDSNKFLKTEVNILRKEKIDISGRGEIGTIVVRPDLKSEGLFHKKGDILIWLTDDVKRIPVKVETKVPIGSVVAKLRNLEAEK